MRVGLGGIWHESNSFVSSPTTVAGFSEYQLFADGALLDALAGTGSELGGAITACRDLGITAVPLLFAGALPSGPVAADDFDSLLADLVERTRRSAELDGLVLALHGAMVVENRPDPEADILRAVRSVVGDRPIAVTLDYHANVSPDLAQLANYLVGYRSYPHEDMAERGAEAVTLVARSVRDRRTTPSTLIKVPMVTLPVAQESHVDPMSSILAAADSVRASAGVAAVSTLPGFAYGDGARLGFSVYVASDRDPAALARELAAEAWSRREAFAMPLLDADDAVVLAMKAAGPAVLVDVADNVGGGSAGDSTSILHALQRCRARGTTVVMWDPLAIDQMYAGDASGAVLEVDVGGRSSAGMGPAFRAVGRVTLHGRVTYPRSSSYMTGQVVDMGRVAVIHAATGPIVVTEQRIVPFDEDHLTVLGIDPRAQQAIVVKAAIAWKAAFGSYCSAALYVAGPGGCPVILDSLTYSARPRPLYPFETMETPWTP